MFLEKAHSFIFFWVGESTRRPEGSSMKYNTTRTPPAKPRSMLLATYATASKAMPIPNPNPNRTKNSANDFFMKRPIVLSQGDANRSSATNPTTPYKGVLVKCDAPSRMKPEASPTIRKGIMVPVRRLTIVSHLKLVQLLSAVLNQHWLQRISPLRPLRCRSQTGPH